MADTIIGGDHGKCHDCSQDHASIIHWGPLVPDGRRTVLCGTCAGRRQEWPKTHKDPLPVPAEVSETMLS